MSTLYDIRILIVNVFSINIVLFTFISTIIFARAQSSNEIEAHPYTHSQDEHDLRYDLELRDEPSMCAYRWIDKIPVQSP